MSDDSDIDNSDFESSDEDSELETGNESSEDEQVENQVVNRMPWFRVLPPEVEDDDDPEMFTEDVGPKNMPDPNSRPVAYFFLTLTLDFIQRIVLETNRYAREFIGSRERIRRYSRLHDWFKVGGVTLTEMKAFLSVILNMSLIKKASFSEYWNTKHKSQETNWFRTMFSQNRFQLILKFFHLVDNNNVPPRNSPNYSPTGKFQCFVDHFNQQSQRHLTPNQNISIDESLIATRGRSVMLQYIPSKSAKFGVKVWMMVEAASGYIIHMIVYRGKRFDPTPRGVSQGSSVVKSLLEAVNFFGKWYHVVCDSFFSSLDLARQLFARGIYFTGTIRQNRQMPQMIKNPQIGEKEYIYMRQGQVLMCSYRERARRKPVRILTTKEKAGQDINDKPNVLHFYNKNMGGVDQADMMLTHYCNNRKTLKVWKKMVFNLLHRTVLNAYILYTKHTADRPIMSRLRFTQCLIEDLAKDHLENRDAQQEPRGRDYVKVMLRKLPNGRQSECNVCSDRYGMGGRRRARTQCRTCGKGLHKTCVNNHLCVPES